MFLLRRTAHSISPHHKPFLPATNSIRRAVDISHPAITSPCAGRRNFSVASTLGEAVNVTADSLSWAHSVGVPWYVAIPLLGIGINAAIRFPLQLYARRLHEDRKPLRPLSQAWARRHLFDQTITGPEVPARVKNLRASGATTKSSRRIYKAWGVQRWKSLLPLSGMIPFVIVSEALRRKCGAPLGWISHQIGLGNADSATAGMGAASSMFDESLVNGGLLWFTDLSSADPYYGLPIICSGILVWSTWGKMSKDMLRSLLSIDGSGRSVNRMQQLVGRTMLLIPILPLLFADLPCAIFLYWGTSFALTRINDSFLAGMITPKTASLTIPRMNKELPFLPPRQSQKEDKSHSKST
ncbi:mitochondrial export translocase oxa2 [Fusarium longipes]|uniref:Mitochondrial export translocase oxa2 n=1 Tax=Fusarium longipes TaxID=694270 RepID=A0A395SK09_9HYPO|nr:mitochondrial export translocase oxa2 [Fusarium longipes]